MRRYGVMMSQMKQVGNLGGVVRGGVVLGGVGKEGAEREV